jgi:hypothetical protein
MDTVNAKKRWTTIYWRFHKFLKKSYDVGVLKSEHHFCSLFSKAWHYVALFQDFFDTLVNGRPPLFRIDSVHQMVTSLSHALLVY